MGSQAQREDQVRVIIFIISVVLIVFLTIYK